MEGMGDVLLILYTIAFLGITGIILCIISLIVGLKKISGIIILLLGLICLFPAGYVGHQKRQAEKKEWNRLGPLFQAINEKDCAKIKEALNNGCNPDENNLYAYPSTPLSYAIKEGDIYVVQLLLEKGADPNIKANGGIPLNLAIFRGDTSILICLLENGADVSLEKGTEPPMQPIQYATGRQSADKAIIEILLRYGADPNAASGGEVTPLQGAVRRNNSEVVRSLLEHEADPLFKGGIGKTPKEIAEKMLELIKTGEISHLPDGQKNTEYIIELLTQYETSQREQ